MLRGWGVWIGGFSCLMAGWGPGAVSARAEEPVETAVSRRVSFCPRAEGENLQLDVARPSRTSRAPMLVFVHGGGWTEGSRDYYSSEIEQAARLGFVAATIDYRLSRPAPAQVQDIRCAIRWLRAQAVSLGGDPARVGVAGGSAGGHLALLAALSPDSFDPSEPWSAYGASVQAVANFYGPTDLSSFIGESPNFAPVVRAIFPDLWSGSPVAWIHRDSPPVLTMHGTSDDTVSYHQALRLDRRASETGARHELVSFPGEGHGFSPENRRVSNDVLFGFFARQLGHGVKRPLFWPRSRHAL